MSPEASPVAEAKVPGFWASVIDAIRGVRHDYTEGSIGRSILLLAIPMVLEMIMESLFGLVNVFFVARLGADAAATVGLTESLLTLLFPIAIGLSIATTATVARRIGEKNPEQASVTAVQSLVAALLVAILFGFFASYFAGDLLLLMGGKPKMVAAGLGYSRILLGGAGAIVLLFVMNAAFRGAGDAAVAMRVLWFANLINIALVPCLINGWGPFPQLGLAGAAVGATIGRGAGFVYQLVILFGGGSRLRVSRSQLRLDVPLMLRLLRISLAGTFQYAIAHLSWLGLTRIIASFGPGAIAGYTIAIRVAVFALLPSWGLCNSAATMVGQSLGARKPERAEQAVWRTAFYNVAFLGTVAVIFIAFAEPIIGAFIQDPVALRDGIDCLRYISFGYPFYAFGMTMVQAFNGAGDTRTPTIVNLFCYWLWEIPLGYALAMPFGLGPQGVFIAIAIAESTTACAGVILFRRGRWKSKRV
ncbi:MAG: MATE family efflux transporter [Bryobacteraceae bacterium]